VVLDRDTEALRDERSFSFSFSFLAGCVPASCWCPLGHMQSSSGVCPLAAGGVVIEFGGGCDQDTYPDVS
jgi:hypothetical protein